MLATRLEVSPEALYLFISHLRLDIPRMHPSAHFRRRSVICVDMVDRDEGGEAHQSLCSGACASRRSSIQAWGRSIKGRCLTSILLRLKVLYHMTHRFVTCLCPNYVFFTYWIRYVLPVGGGGAHPYAVCASVCMIIPIRRLNLPNMK